MMISQSLQGKSILLVIGGGIAAYKCLDLIRRLRERGGRVRCVMSEAAQQFVTPTSVGALTGETVFTDIWDREAEQDVGHIRLAREADLVLVAPATADLIAKMAHGLANDMASTVLLATESPILVAPAMNPAMWNHPATQRNIETLDGDGIMFVGPDSGEMAESGEAGLGRMAEPLHITGLVERMLDDRPKPLAGKRAIVTSGPTREELDPVRYISKPFIGQAGPRNCRPTCRCRCRRDSDFRPRTACRPGRRYRGPCDLRAGYATGRRPCTTRRHCSIRRRRGRLARCKAG